MEKLHKTENEMYLFYKDLHRELKDDDIKKKIAFIRDQELGHIKMATTVISMLSGQLKDD